MSKATYQPPVDDVVQLPEDVMTHEEFELALELYRLTHEGPKASKEETQ